MAPHGLCGCGGLFFSFVFYSVVGGWILLYVLKAVTGSLSGLTQEQYGTVFGTVIENPIQTLIAQLVFMIMTVAVVAKGVQKGIERVSAVLMPILFVLFLLLVLRSVTLDHAVEGIRFLLVPHFEDLTPESILYALGQAFLH